MRLRDSTPNISFGTAARQMLNLWGTQYGIGVQTATVYFRTDSTTLYNGFAWYRGGTHNDALGNPGGGTTMMKLEYCVSDGGIRWVHDELNRRS